MNIALWLARAAEAAPRRAALGFGTATVADYGALGERVARLAGALTAAGLVAGDRVAIIAGNSPDYVEVIHAIWHAGCGAVPLNAKLHGAEIAYALEHSGARIAFVGEDLAASVGAHAPATLERMIVIGSDTHRNMRRSDAVGCAPRSGQDLAWLFYTSGTTGRPKGATLTHGNLAVMTYAYLAEVDACTPGDAILHAAPMSHGSGLYMMGHVLRHGVNVVPESGGFDAGEIFRLFDAWPRTSMFAAPTMVKRLVECPEDCNATNIRTVVWGGAPMYVEDAVRAIDRFGPRFAQIYGQGESPMTISCLPREEIATRDEGWLARLATAGRAFNCLEVAIADDEGRELPRGETGEIVCRGPVVMPGYWADPAASAKALGTGWLRTGDVGSIDEAGYLTLKDRSKDLIISGGSNIYPREVEEVLLTHPGVRECSVIGRPDREWGEVVVAYVVGDAAHGELDQLCLSRIARFKRPKSYVSVPELPKNNYGKILKNTLRDWDRKAAAQK